MKTTILLIALILGCIIPTYSQLNRNSKANTVYPNLSFYQKQNDNLGKPKLPGDYSSSLKDEVWNSYVKPTIGTFSNKNTNKNDSPYNMPCFKPEGTFSMRVYKPDPTIVYTILLKKF